MRKLYTDALKEVEKIFAAWRTYRDEAESDRLIQFLQHLRYEARVVRTTGFTSHSPASSESMTTSQ
jgi:hypothetical protein